MKTIADKKRRALASTAPPRLPDQQIEPPHVASEDDDDASDELSSEDVLPDLPRRSHPKSRHGDRGDKDGDGDEQYLTGPDVCRRYRITSMSLWRWLQDEKLNFPQPALNVRKRRFWRERNLIAWERDAKRREVA